MRKEDGLTPVQREFEEALMGLQPVGLRIDRDMLMYRAGYAAGHRGSRLWQAATAVMAAAFAASLAVQGLVRQTDVRTQIAEIDKAPREVIYTLQEPRTQYPPAASEYSYLALRDAVLEKGLAALPSPAPSPGITEPTLIIEGFLGRGPRSAGTADTDLDEGFSNPGGRS